MDYRNIPRFDCQKHRSTFQAETPDIPVYQGHVDGIHCGHLVAANGSTCARNK